MSNVFDVANYIIDKTEKLTAMKLQKLCYYAQAWSLVWDEAPLFDNKIEAWANGPVIPDLYREHKGQYYIDHLAAGDSNNLSPEQKETIKNVIDFYGKYNSQQLSDLTHMEAPWRDARRGLPDGERSNVEIPPAAMQEYYSSLN